MKILVACEFSQIVCEAFDKKGHDVMSCDLLPGEKGLKHYQGDARDILNNKFDLMIAHPPCTYLSNVQSQWFNEKWKYRFPDRLEKQKEAIDFFMLLVNANINKICIENPVGIMSKVYRKYDQIIHPYYFGDHHMKRTCLWLKNLKPLVYVKGLYPKPKPEFFLKTNNKPIYFTEANKSSKIRSTFWEGIAYAMANQWSY